ncbi:MAG: VWA domain-containing protein [Chloroflexaceae bacterium]|nr:VWA domain-containing protein [Chloroflexaceae bacterium]
MDDRVVNFVAALRAAGVRVSVAESADALRAIESAGITDKDLFRSALQATLVKDVRCIPEFQRLFPLYFDVNPPPPMQQMGQGSGRPLTPEEQQQLQQLLQQMLAGMSPQQLAQLFQAMMQGQAMDSEQLRQMMQAMLQQPGQFQPGRYGRSPQQMQRMQMRLAQQAMQAEQLEAMLQDLLQQLREAGMDESALREIEATARANQQALAEQIAQELREQMLNAMQQGDGQTPFDQLLDRPFEYFDGRDMEDMRRVVARLAARLRSRAALRQRRGRTGTLDAKRTIRQSMRYGGVPFQIYHRHRHLKPKLLVLIDRSESTREVTRFLLMLIYALQDQVSRTRCFAFIDDLTDISTYFAESRPEQAIEQILNEVRSRRSYSTDLGNSLGTLVDDYFGCVDRRTTVIVLGDGRNNHNDPNLAAFGQIKQRAKRMVWFNPEPPHLWGVYDPGSLSSDMLEYAALCDAVHHVSNPRQLMDAVDTLFD